jgi:hypothetical protein
MDTKPETACAAAVAQTGSLLYRGLSIRRREFHNESGNFPAYEKAGAFAGCQPATQQVANLRYGAASEAGADTRD